MTTAEAVTAHLAAAAAALHALSESGDRERAAMWWTARQATDTALETLAALRAPSGPRRLELLREALGIARGTVESGKMAIYKITNSRID